MSQYQDTSSSDYILSSSPGDGYVYDPNITFDNTPRSFANNSSDSAGGTAAFDHNQPGMVILPNGERLFVKNKAAYFVDNPAAKASTEASINDHRAWSISHREQRRVSDAKKAERKRKRDFENEQIGAHGCVGGEKPVRCGGCGGNGCGGGIADKYYGLCRHCDGEGYIFYACGKCAADKKKAGTKGGWSKEKGKLTKAPRCEED